jgi:hypothetical protein
MNKKENTKKITSVSTPIRKTEFTTKPFDSTASRDMSDLDKFWSDHIDSMLNQEFVSIEAAVEEIANRVLLETSSESQISAQEKNQFIQIILDNAEIRDKLIKVLKIKE